MAFKQLKDLIEWITEYHEMLEKQYETLARSQGDERMQMALSFLASREAELFRELAANQQAEARLQSRDIGRLEMY